MPESLVSFIQVLRSHDVRISPAETLDAMQVATTLGYSDRQLLRDGLGMTLAKTPEEEAIFLQCFDRFFDRQLSDFSEEAQREDSESIEADEAAEASRQNTTENEYAPASEPSALEQAAESDPDLQALMQSELMQALLNNDRNALSVAMNRAGDAAGLQNIQMFTQKGQFTRKILDAMG